MGARLAKEKDDVQRRLNAAVTEERLEKSRRLAIESEKQKLEEKIKAEENAKRANDAERSASEKAKQQTELQELLKKKDAAVAALATAERKKQEAKDIPTFSAPPATPSSPAETPLAASSSSPPANDPSPVAVSASSLTAVTPPVSSQPPPIPALKRLNDPMEPIVKVCAFLFSDVNHEMDVRLHGWVSTPVQPVIVPWYTVKEGCCISSQPFLFVEV